MNKTKLAALFGTIAAIASALVASHSGHPALKPAPAPSAATVLMWQDTCLAVMDEHRHRPMTDGELAGCIAVARSGGQVEQLRAWVDALPADPAPPKPPAIELEPLTTDGRIFLQAGMPWRYRGVSAFQLLDRFANGEDIEPFLNDFAGYNVLRVWPYVPAKDWGAKAWDSPDTATVLRFVDYVRARGFYVELTLLTDDDQGRLAPAKALIAALAAAHPVNVLLEAGNEPTTHKRIDTPALRSALAASGFLYTSGDYEDSTRFYGSYLVAHTGRDAEWPRRAHDMLEYFNGGGPNAPTDPAHKVPGVCDEPIRPDQSTGERTKDFLAYFGTCSVLGAGATFHFENGKYGQRPTDEEKQFAAIALQAMTAFPADAPNGAYSRPVEQSLRTYVVGASMVRVRPLTTIAPAPGWRALDEGGVLWAR